MRADQIEVDVTFEVDDNDFFAKLDDTKTTVSTVSSNGAGFDVVANTFASSVSGAIAYDGDLDYVDPGLYGVKTTVEVFVNSTNGTSRVYGEAAYDTVAIGNALNSYALRDGDEVIVLFHPVIDYYSEGDVYNSKSAAVNPDKIDDREQTIVTIEQETWSDIKGAGTGKYTKAQYVTDGTEDQLVELIMDLPEYDESHRVGSGKDRKTYRLVYSINGDEVTADWDVRPDKDTDRFGKVTPSNDKDTNGDGKVSCDEYYGTTGLEWSDKLNACVVSSTGDAVVTIPNTATK